LDDRDHMQWLVEPPAFWVEMWNLRRQSEQFRPAFANADFLEGFDKAGKFDPGERISLKGIDFSHGDFTEAVLMRADLTGADFTRADLTRVDLWGAVLTNAKFYGANLASADLRGVDLTNADLQQANLAGADLNGANLANADLTNANLEHAHLAKTDLANANLRDATLTNAVFTGAEPWKAILYPPRKRVLEISRDGRETVATIEDLLREIRSFQEHHPDTSLYFRGESQCGWDLLPSVMRDGYIDFEREMLVDLMSRRPEEFDGRTAALAQWVLGQHHGLRTRFLDITKNPLVALFHACEQTDQKNDAQTDHRIHVFAVPREMVKPFNSDTISVIANFAKLSRCEQEALLGKRVCSVDGAEIETHQYREATRRLYQLIRQEKPYFDERIDPRDWYRVFVVEPQQSSERVRAQSGAFLLSAFHERFERVQVEGCNDGIPVYGHYALTIPWESKRDVINDLIFLNITRETLYPGLDASAKAVTGSYPKPRS